MEEKPAADSSKKCQKHQSKVQVHLLLVRAYLFYKNHKSKWYINLLCRNINNSHDDCSFTRITKLNGNPVIDWKQNMINWHQILNGIDTETRIKSHGTIWIFTRQLASTDHGEPSEMCIETIWRENPYWISTGDQYLSLINKGYR